MIPAYDELSNLELLIPILHEVLEPSLKDDFKVFIIVRNQEKDEVFSRIKSLGVTPVRRFPSDSFGDAIRTGISMIESSSDFTVFMDADGSHSPKTIPRLIECIKSQDADVVIASRYANGGSSDNGIVLRAMSKILNKVFATVLGIKAKDISTNFKVYQSRSLLQVNLECNAFDILEELLLKLQRLNKRNFKVIEIPDHFYNRISGESKRRLGLFILGYITTLFRLKFKSK